MIFEITFWTLIALVLYSYLGYTVILYIIALFKKGKRKAKDDKGFYEPEVTLFVAAYNEKDFISEKIRNSAELDYPPDKVKHVWVTDGSDDGTPDLLKKYRHIKVFHENQRNGKIGAINRGMEFVTSPIVIFSDCNSMLNKECIREIVKIFRDESVGCVAGEKRISASTSDKAVGSGEGLYWKYESVIKHLESEVNSTTGAAGELFAIRSSLFETAEQDTLLDDFVISLNIARKGFYIKYTPHAYAVEAASISIKEELKRKIRIACGGIQTMIRFPDLLNPFKTGILSLQYFSHKVLRWTVVPVSFILVYLLNIVLIFIHPQLVYQAIFAVLSAYYLLVILGAITKNRSTHHKYLFIPYYIFMMNMSIILGYIRYFKGKQSVNWEKAKRDRE